MPVAVVLLLAGAVPAQATFPFPAGGDPYDYTRLHITNGACEPLGPGQRVPPGSDLPAGFDCRAHWKLSDHRAAPGDPDYDPLVALNPQELHGRKGPGTNRAWEVTTGRPDTVIAVLDSGIRWHHDLPALVNKFYLNRGELPVPGGTQKGAPLSAYDVNHDGVLNVQDYASDPRVSDFPDDDNTVLDPADLIRTFSDGVDDDGNGYVDDISGWDFFEDDNDPADDVDFGHGTGESHDSAAEIEVAVTQCPNCMLMELRVGDSFVADVNHWAEAVVYATDNGASVVQEALGTLNHTAFAQAAADYAYRHGVLIVASEADESAGHHNYPAALNHTMTVNSLTRYLDPVQLPRTYLAFNGCTNFGGYTWVSVASASCSSDATGQASGMAGLVYSAARNAIDRGVLSQRPDTAGRPLSAEEAKQLFRAAADDIDFSSPAPPFPPNNFFTSLPASQRFVTTPGWDQITGFGRANADRMVRLAAAGAIPPEADIVSPRWWQPLGTSGTVEVVGRAAAPRASSFSWRLEVAPGVQPPRWPAADTWIPVASGTSSSPVEGVLGVLDLAQVRAAIDAAPPPYTPADDPSSRDLPERDAFRVRLVVSDDRPDTPDAIEQRQYFSRADPDLLSGFPRFLGADGAGSPAFADLDGDGRSELVISDGNGFVHALRADGTEAPGWPVHSGPVPLPSSGDNAYTRGEIPTPVWAPFLLGSPAVADLDGDGWPEVSAADAEGFLWVWHHDGAPAAGFPVRPDPAFSSETACQLPGAPPRCDDFGPRRVRDAINTVYHAFTAPPAVGDLDPATPGRELVVGSNDGHVYAFHADGSPVAGWPVLLRDPAKVAAVDPVTHRVTHTQGSNVRYGRKVLTTPSLGDVDGDGDLEVAVTVNEEYADPPNWSVLRAPEASALGPVSGPGNTRVYLLHHDGAAHPQTPATAATPHPHDQAYLPGWPVAVGMLVTELLPYVGEGSNGAPTLADVDGDGRLEVGVVSIVGPPYLWRADGTSFYGTGPDGKAVPMASSGAEFHSAATDAPSLGALGGGVFGRLGGPASPLVWATGAGGLRRLLDVVLPEQQLGAEDHLGVWDARSGTFAPGFPAQVNDLQFFNTPAVADVTGDGLAEVLTSSALYDLRAYGLGGVAPAGWPKFTAGWSVSTPGLGDLDGDGRLEVALATREGNLFVWRTGGAACQHPEWPKYQHDLANTGTYGTDATPPGPVTGLQVRRSGDQLVVSWRAGGGDGPCGRAARYEVRAGGRTVSVAAAPAGQRQVVRLRGRGPVSVWGVDRAGNLGPPSTAG